MASPRQYNEMTSDSRNSTHYRMLFTKTNPVPASMLNRFSNRFFDPRTEESYQLYSASTSLHTSQYVLMILMATQVAAFIVYCTIDLKTTSGLTFISTGVDSERLNWTCSVMFGYCLVCIPFTFMPLSYLDTIGKCRILVYLFRRYWKHIAASVVVLFTIGIQTWSVLHVGSNSKLNYKAYIAPYLQCNNDLTDVGLPAEVDREYFSDATSFMAFLTFRNSLIEGNLTFLLAVLFNVLGSTLAISLQLDFTQGVVVMVLTCSGLVACILHPKIGESDFLEHGGYEMNVLLLVLISVPVMLVLAAMYYLDRSARAAYVSKLVAERENTALKSNLTITRDELINKSITDTERFLVERILLDDHLASRSVFDEVSIPFKELHISKTIGYGSTSQILLGEYLGVPIAIKRLKRTLIQAKHLHKLKNQVETLAALRHPNIVQFIGFSYDSISNICIIMEHMEGGDVRAILRSQSSPINLTWNDPLLKIAIDAAQGVSYLHNSEPSILHRDLKCQNLLCSATYGCKVADFGESKRYVKHVRRNTMMHYPSNQMNHTMVGTPYWLAPEILREEPYDTKIDCYAFGMVLVELETRKDPYHSLSDTKTPLEIMLLVAEGRLVPNLPQNCLPLRYQLILDCLHNDPAQRPTMKGIVNRLQGEIMHEMITHHELKTLQQSRETMGLIPNRPMLRRQSKQALLIIPEE